MDPTLFLNLYRTVAVCLQPVASLFLSGIDGDSVMGLLFWEVILLDTCNSHLASNYLVEVGGTLNTLLRMLLCVVGLWTTAPLLCSHDLTRFGCLTAKLKLVKPNGSFSQQSLFQGKNKPVKVCVFLFRLKKELLSFGLLHSFGFSVAPVKEPAEAAAALLFL